MFSAGVRLALRLTAEIDAQIFGVLNQPLKVFVRYIVPSSGSERKTLSRTSGPHNCRRKSCASFRRVKTVTGPRRTPFCGYGLFRSQQAPVTNFCPHRLKIGPRSGGHCRRGAFRLQLEERLLVRRCQNVLRQGLSQPAQLVSFSLIRHGATH
jgi:hypothetical protein